MVFIVAGVLYKMLIFAVNNYNIHNSDVMDEYLQRDLKDNLKKDSPALVGFATIMF